MCAKNDPCKGTDTESQISCFSEQRNPQETVSKPKDARMSRPNARGRWSTVVFG